MDLGIKYSKKRLGIQTLIIKKLIDKYNTVHNQVPEI